MAHSYSSSVTVDEMFVEYRRTGDRALRNRLIEANVGLAETLAWRYASRGDRREDLVQVAMLGLLKSVERFEPERGLAFSTFATPTILGELKRHFRDSRWALRVPRRVQERLLEVQSSLGPLTQELGRSPTIAEIARAAHTDDEMVIEALDAGQALAPASLDAGADADLRPLDASEITHAENRIVVSALLKQLPTRQRTLIELRFFEGLSQSKIGERLGISQMQVSRLLNRTLVLLRESLGEHDT
jgi:RNA polymerase sigma-B factor